MMKKLFLWFVFFSLGMQAQNIAFADANFKEALLGTNFNNHVSCYDHNGMSLLLDQNQDGEIQLSEAAAVKKMVFSQKSNYTSLEGINSFVNLEEIQYENNGSSSHVHGKITSINIDGLSKLKTFNLSEADIENVSIKNCVNLLDIISAYTDSYNISTFDSHGNTQVLTVDNCSQVKSIVWTNNNVAVANITKSPNLSWLELRGNSLVTFDASKLTGLEHLDLSNNQETWGPINGEANFDPSLASVHIGGLSKLKYLNVSNQVLANLDVTQAPLLEILLCGHNKLLTLDISHQLALLSLDCSYNQLINLDASKMTVVEDFTDSTSGYLHCNNNQLQNLNIKNIKTDRISANNNQLTHVDFENVSSSYGFNFSSNLLTTLDLRKYHFNPDFGNYFGQFDVSNNRLTAMFLKNGISEIFNEENPGSNYSNFNGNPDLKYICSDDDEIGTFKRFADAYGYQININSYCSFTPSGNYNTISGKVRIDENNNGCDTSDNPFEFLKLKINDGATSGQTFSQKDGKYEFYTQTGDFNLTALSENPSLFNISPATFSTSFVDNNNNVFTQDICVTNNGNQNDAEVMIAPLSNARPGFNATYKLVWRNKGNTVLTGKVVLNYDANKMTFQSSSIPYSLVSNGSIEFDYSNLKPFANTSSEIKFTINTPTNPTNPVNSGDILAFNAQITPSNTDITPEDNNFAFNHTVVNSFDPNDIVCLEGETVPVTAVGKYFHYVINFENTGTAEAENIVVKMTVDPTEFDINTLQLQNASAEVQTKIVGDQVEFIFNKINLATGGHGNVLLKMRSKSNLVEGDTINNIADIYFDYNFPIVTNDYVTTINNTSNVLAAQINYAASDFSTNNYPVEFDASLSTGSVSSYQWEFSGNPSISSSSAVKPTVTFNLPGNYTAKLTVSDAENHSSVKTVSFSIGGNTADLSTGKNADNNFIAIDSDDDDWKGYDINGTEMAAKVRHTFPGWSYADIGNGNSSRWISLNNLEGYYTYKSGEFAIPENSTDAKLNLRSLSFVRNWTYLVKINPDGSEDEIEITKTQWLSDGFKGWLNSRSPKVEDHSLSAGRYYIKVLVFSNNAAVRQSLDVNALVSCSAGLIFTNKKSTLAPTLGNEDMNPNEISVSPIPTYGEVNVIAKQNVKSLELYDSSGRIVQKQILSLPTKVIKFNINANQGIYYLKIITENNVITRKIIKN